jgi:hypothetical protein
LQEVDILSALSSLVVLDLVGNPLMLTAGDDHRLWLLYKLGGLKVLNGIAPDAAELAAAQAQHAGRLTLGMLVGVVAWRLQQARVSQLACVSC